MGAAGLLESGVVEKPTPPLDGTGTGTGTGTASGIARNEAGCLPSAAVFSLVRPVTSHGPAALGRAFGTSTAAF